MHLYPAIDLKDGHCVRLYQGNYAEQTDYDTDPVEVADRFAAAGATWIHVVDLDAALTGVAVNRHLVAAIVDAVAGRARVQAGGGVRSDAAARELVAAGVARVVLGTVAVEQPELVRQLASSYPVAVGIDTRAGDVAVRGWTEASGIALAELVARYEDDGVDAVVVTDIGRDGTLAGPDLDGLRGALGATAMAVIASGGVGRLEDLEALAGVAMAGRRLAGAIVGKALHDGRFGVEEALAACAASG